MDRLPLAERMRGLAIVLLVVAGASGTGHAAVKKAVTIDEMLKRRGDYPSAAIWRPDGKAYVYQEHGKVMLFDALEGKATEWLNLASLEKPAKKPEADEKKPFDWQNRRVAANSMEWFPDGKELLVAMPSGLFRLEKDGKAALIGSSNGAEEDPQLSPDGKHVLYRRQFNLYVLTVGDGTVTQLTQDGGETRMNGKLDWVYPEELEISTAAWWSPDSKFVAYLQFETSKEFVYPQADLLGERAVAEPERYPQAGTANAEVKLGVVGVEGGATKWMEVGDTAYTLISRVNWVPGSKEIAVQRLSRVQDKLDLLFADRETGKTRTILQEESKTWVNFETSIHLLKKQEAFLWTSEAGDGYRHLYLYGNDGKLMRQLTHGEWEVREIVAVDEEHNLVYFTSNEASPLEEDLYSVTLTDPRWIGACGTHAGGIACIVPQRLTKESGTHHISAASNGAYYLDTYSSLTEPPETTLHDGAGKLIVATRPADRKMLEEFEILPTEIVKVAAADGTVLYGKVIKPAGFEAGKKYPVVVFVYGGPGVGQAVRNSWPGMGWDQVLAHRGYVIWQLDNRGTFGRGHAFEAPIYRELGKTELADQRAGIEKLISLGFADPKRIGMYGWSYGGYMTLYSLLHAPELFRAGIAGAPVTDWHNYDTIYTERYMGLPGENKTGYMNSSNVLAAEHLKAKLMIVHNFEDDNVLFQNTMQMVNALEGAGKQFDFLLFPQKSHGVGGTLRKTLYESMTGFLDRNLKGE